MLHHRNVRRALIAGLAVIAALLLAAPSALVQAQEGACGESVVVKTGDTLYALSRRCGVTVRALLAANPSVTNPDRIYIGQTLNIPAGTGGPVASQASLSLSAAQGPPGTEVTATLAGATPESTLPGRVEGIGAGTLADITVETDASGAGTYTFVIPQGAAPGQRYVVVLDNVARSNEFLVVADGQGGGGTGGPGVYVVRTGDTLYSLAQTYGLTVADLLAANPQIANPNRIEIGDEIRIPGSGGADGMGGGSTYVVQPGDTLFRIALNHGTTVQAMMDANPVVTDPTRIYVGQMLVLP